MRPPLRRGIYRAWPGIDDEPAALAARHLRVAPRVVGCVAVLALRLVELVPARLLVGDVSLPLDVDELAGITAAFHGVADLERAPLGRLFVIDIDLEARRLPLDAALAVLEVGDRHRLHAVGTMH